MNSTSSSQFKKTAILKLITAVAATFFSSSLHAEEGESSSSQKQRSFYVQFDLGFIPETHSRIAGAQTGRLDHDGSIVPATLTLGWKPKVLQDEDSAWGFELGFYNRNLSVDRVTLGSTVAATDGRLRVDGVMASARYEKPVGNGITPYVTAGIGFACAEIKNAPTLKLTDRKSRNESLATHFGAGIGYQPDFLGRASLWLGYDILVTDSLHFNTQAGDTKLMRIRPQTVTAGLRLAF